VIDPVLPPKAETWTRRRALCTVILGLFWLYAVPLKFHFIVVWLFTAALYRLYHWLVNK
jgi:hypothetical protein